MTTPDKERCTERVQLVLTPSDAAALRRLARETGVSMAGWVRVAVRNAARDRTRVRIQRHDETETKALEFLRRRGWTCER